MDPLCYTVIDDDGNGTFVEDAPDCLQEFIENGYVRTTTPSDQDGILSFGVYINEEDFDPRPNDTMTYIDAWAVCVKTKAIVESLVLRVRPDLTNSVELEKSLRFVQVQMFVPEQSVFVSDLNNLQTYKYLTEFVIKICDRSNK